MERFGAASMSIRSQAHALRCSCGTVLNRNDRLARQAIASHSLLRAQASRHDNVCIDGFVGFDRSQYFPNNITISIASASRYVLAFTHATLRRSGNMRPEQKKRRDRLYEECEFERKPLDRSFSELLDELELDRPPRFNSPLVIITDEKIEYLRTFVAHRLYKNQDEEHRVVHSTVNSRLPRTYVNPLFPSNYLDREIRKDLAAHRRESTCFCRNVANGLSRMACYLGWHNYAKRYLIKAPILDDRTHGEEAGILRRDIIRQRRMVFSKRVFLSRCSLDPVEEKIWKKEFRTPGALRASYLPAYALG